MRNKSKSKSKSKSNIKNKSKWLYKQKIGHLAYKVTVGDSLAESKLKRELERNPIAETILEKIILDGTIKDFKTTKARNAGFCMSRCHDNIYFTKKSPALKTVSGGAFGSGKR